MIEVLIVEDDPMVRDINTKFLNRIEGFHLAGAVGSLEESRRIVDENNPPIDLILLDVFLPREKGIDFLKWLRQRDVNADVILITADKTTERIQEAFRYGAVDYLIKPFSFERFKEALSQFKDRKNAFKKREEMDQQTLDQLFAPSSEISEDEGLAKGLNRLTYKLICESIEAKKGYFTADELSEEIKIARVTVRRYLDYLERDGKIDKLIEYGKVGRPQHKYIKKELK